MFIGHFAVGLASKGGVESFTRNSISDRLSTRYALRRSFLSRFEDCLHDRGIRNHVRGGYRVRGVALNSVSERLKIREDGLSHGNIGSYRTAALGAASDPGTFKSLQVGLVLHFNPPFASEQRDTGDKGRRQDRRNVRGAAVAVSDQSATRIAIRNVAGERGIAGVGRFTFAE